MTDLNESCHHGAFRHIVEEGRVAHWWWRCKGPWGQPLGGKAAQGHRRRRSEMELAHTQLVGEGTEAPLLERFPVQVEGKLKDKVVEEGKARRMKNRLGRGCGRRRGWRGCREVEPGRWGLWRVVVMEKTAGPVLAALHCASRPLSYHPEDLSISLSIYLLKPNHNFCTQSDEVISNCPLFPHQQGIARVEPFGLRD